MIEYCAEDVSMPTIDVERLNDWIEDVVTSYRKSLGELCYVFCSDKYILNVNNEYLQHDYYTDIITFDYSEENIISGDLIISLDTVRTNAEKFSQAYDNELLRVIIHGILHLCGLKDKSPEDELKMREAEEKALALLK